jgi:hypothetical protein
MEKDVRDEFNGIDDRLMALEFAFAVLAKELDRSHSLDLAQVAKGLQSMATQLRNTPADVQKDSHRDLTPVAVLLDELRVALSSVR